jgi:uncharacterized membrane protein
MRHLSRHVTQCLIAGVVALLPIAGLALTVVQLERQVAQPWLQEQPFYFPGLGLLAATLLIYAIGLTVSTFVGRWAWSTMDRLLDRLPALGRLYQTLKQILGYSQGEDALFRRVVLLAAPDNRGAELGLVTQETLDPNGRTSLLVYIPGAPNPASGRLVLVDPARTTALSMSPSEALQAIVAVGTVKLDWTPARVVPTVA